MAITELFGVKRGVDNQVAFQARLESGASYESVSVWSAQRLPDKHRESLEEEHGRESK